MPRKTFYFEIFAVSLAAILLEISYTRIFSFKVWYYFTYLIIGIALMGLGAGGVLVAVSRRLRQTGAERLIPGLCFVGGASVLCGYLIIASTQLNISLVTSEPSEILKLAGVCLVLTIPFLAAGIIISTILSLRPEIAGRLYGADLLGAALGCISCIPLLVALGPPRTILLSGFIFTIGGLRLALRSRMLLTAGGTIGLMLLFPLSIDKLLPDPVVDVGKTFRGSQKGDHVLFSKWHPIFRVDVVGHRNDDDCRLNHDGQVGSAIHRFTGAFSDLAYLQSDERSLPFQVLPEGPNVLIIGSAGGIEVVASLFFGANHVTGVELNPVTLSLLTDTFADYTGHLSENPRVTLVNGDGRWFMKQSKENYDLIWFVAPDSYAAMNASSAAGFVLAESYLYTVEMLGESLKHLTDQGIICAQFGEINYVKKPNRTTRYVATARQAYAEEGIENFKQYIAVSNSRAFLCSLSTVLLSKSPLTFDQINCFQEGVSQLIDGRVTYLPSRPVDGTSVNQVITLDKSQLEKWYKAYPYEVDPTFDDSPYFWHFARFRDALISPLDLSAVSVDKEDAIAERISFTLLAVVTIFAAFFLLLPFATIHRTWNEIPNKARACVYFASLGLGFMFIEIPLIQMFTLFLGYPTHSLSVTLFGLLLFSGLGSLLSEHYTAHRTITLGILLAALVGLILFFQFGLPIVIDRFVGGPSALRILLSIAMIAPLGLCMGAFMPIGLMTVAKTTPHKREYVAWAWAVNGFFSVVASILSTILAMVFGFKLVLLLALVIYAVGALSLTRFPDSRT